MSSKTFDFSTKRILDESIIGIQFDQQYVCSFKANHEKYECFLGLVWRLFLWGGCASEYPLNIPPVHHPTGLKPAAGAKILFWKENRVRRFHAYTGVKCPFGVLLRTSSVENHLRRNYNYSCEQRQNRWWRTSGQRDSKESSTVSKDA